MDDKLTKVPSLVTLAGKNVFTMDGSRKTFVNRGLGHLYEQLRTNYITNYFQNLTIFDKTFDKESLQYVLANEYDDKLQLIGPGFTVMFYDIDRNGKEKSNPCSVYIRPMTDLLPRALTHVLSPTYPSPTHPLDLIYSFSAYNEEWFDESYEAVLIIRHTGDIEVYQHNKCIGVNGYITNRYENQDRLYVRDIIKFIRLM